MTKKLPDLDVESTYWKKGYRFIVGIDEVGRGSWAGPLVAAGVILAPDFKIPVGFAESKQVASEKRVFFAEFIRKNSQGTYIACISNRKVDKIGLSKATSLAFRQIARKINPTPDFCLIDAFHISYFAQSRQLAIKGGDLKCASIAAASIIAKVFRDDLMDKLHAKYPMYGFDKNKGYGTAFHQKAIAGHGLSQIHRASYDFKFLSI